MKLSELMEKAWEEDVTNHVINDWQDRVEELEETIDKLKSCLNCTHCYNTEIDVYCNKSKQYLVDFSPCGEWEINELTRKARELNV